MNCDLKEFLVIEFVNPTLFMIILMAFIGGLTYILCLSGSTFLFDHPVIAGLLAGAIMCVYDAQRKRHFY